MSIALVLFTDGRDDLLEKTIESAQEWLHGPITRQVIHTDNGNTHRANLQTRYPDFEVIGGQRKGFGGAINRAWSWLNSLSMPEKFVFHLEDDFTFHREIDLEGMMRVLTVMPNLKQLCLRRQPWNEQEEAAGGIVEMWPDEYVDCRYLDHQWLEHRLFFSTNPSLYRMDLTKDGWPVAPRSESLFSDFIFQDRQAVCGFWGSRHSGEWCTHIGMERVGRMY